MDRERLFQLLDQFKIETPSWGYADTGTRFGKFRQPAAASTIEEKLADAGVVNKFTGAAPSVAVHVAWDFSMGVDATATAKVAEKRATSAGRSSYCRCPRRRIDCGALFIARWHRQIVEDARRTDDRGGARLSERHLDHFEPEPGRVRIVQPTILAALELISRAHGRGSRDIDVNIIRIARLRHDRVRMRAAAGLHARHELRMRDVGDIEDADAAHAVLADRIGNAAKLAIRPAVGRLGRHEQQIFVNGYIIL